MSTTAVQNAGTFGAAAERLIDLPDAEFLKEFGIDIGEGDASDVAETPAEKQEVPQDDKATNAPGTEQTDAEGEGKTEPEAEAAEGSTDTEGEKPVEAPAAEAKKPLTQFTVLDAEGKETAAPTVGITFKANGKVHENVPLDKVVRLAQSGFYNEQLQAKNEALEETHATFTQKYDDVAAALEDQRLLNVRLLQDDDFLAATRERFAEAQSPQARADRAEAQLRQLNLDRQAETVRAEGQQFFSTDVLPRLNKVIQDNPTITEDELYGKFQRTIAPLLRNGMVPKQAWNKVTAFLNGDLGEWAAQLQEKRSAEKANPKAQALLTKAQEEATKAKRKLGKALAPGSAVSGTKLAGKPKDIRNTEDAAEDIYANLFPDTE